MNQDSMQLIKDHFAELPQEVRSAITAPDLLQKMRAIGDKYNLLLDKQGDLQRSILFVMLGLIPSREFVPSISSGLNVNTEVANNIAKDVNEQILAPIRTYLREWEERAEQDEAAEETTELGKDGQNSDFQSIGGFTVEPSPMTARQQSEETTIENKPDLIKSIENPEPAPKSFVASNKIGTDPLVDHLLTTPVTVPPQIIERPVNGASQTAPKSSGPDPYREATS
jgi:hypothetical protein